jgi:hypothetical protein
MSNPPRITLQVLDRVVDDLRRDGKAYVTEKQLAARIRRTQQMQQPMKRRTVLCFQGEELELK